MGFFDALIYKGVEYRLLAEQAREFIVSEELSESEQGIIAALTVDGPSFVAERRLLLAVLILTLLEHYEWKTQKQQIGLAASVFMRYLDHYFTNIPGVDAAKGSANFSRAHGEYFNILDSEALAEKFLKKLNSDKLGDVEHTIQVYMLSELIKLYEKYIIVFIEDRIVKLK